MPLTDAVPSSAADVLVRNASDLDLLINGAAISVENRTGTDVRSFAGINQDASDQIERIGFEQPVAYNIAGQTLLRVTQTVTNGGLIYAPAFGTVFPFVTSGAFNPLLWRVINSIDAIAIYSDIQKSNISQLKMYSPLFDGQVVFVSGYLNIFDGGGGRFVWDSSSVIPEDGGTCFLSNVMPSGRWVRLYFGNALVNWFGARGNGINDDLASINLAITATRLKKISIEFQAGIYASSGMLDFTGCWVVGKGRTVTTLQINSAGTAVQFTNSIPNHNEYKFSGRFKGICISGNAGTTKLLHVRHDNHFRCVDVNLKEGSTASGVGLQVDGVVLGYFESVYCSNNSQEITNRVAYGLIVDRDSVSLARATANTFLNCVFEGANADGIAINHADGCIFIGGTSENNLGNGVTLSADSRMNTFIGGSYEANSGYADVYDSGYNNTFEKCYTGKLFYVDSVALLSKITGGYHQSINSLGARGEVSDLQYSFFASGGDVNTSLTTCTKNIQNKQTGTWLYKPKPASTIGVTASPFTYINQSGMTEEVFIHSGVVSQIAITRGNAPIAYLPNQGAFILNPTDGVIVSYSSIPTMSSIPLGFATI